MLRARETKIASFLTQGEACQAAGAEAAFRAGLKAFRGDGVIAAALAENRRSAAVAMALARLLTAGGQAREALAVTGRFVAEAQPEHGVLAAHADTLILCPFCSGL